MDFWHCIIDALRHLYLFQGLHYNQSQVIGQLYSNDIHWYHRQPF
jgi:hypothetical protein